LYTGNNKSKLRVNANNIQLDIDTAVPLGLLSNELMTNAIKYAFASVENPELSVELQALRQGSYRLVVHDNGPGFPASFDPRTSRSLGTRLVNRLADQLFGEVHFHSRQGARVEVTFKDTEARREED